MERARQEERHHGVLSSKYTPLYSLIIYADFYLYLFALQQEAVKNLSHKIFHEHKQVEDNELKERLKVMLDDDDDCRNHLSKLESKGHTFDELWDEKIYSAVSI